MTRGSHFPNVEMEHRELNQINAVRQLRGDLEPAPFEHIDELVYKDQ